jgi:hypothetical protein
MRYTLLGNSGLRVSEVALGTMTFGTDWGWGAPAGDPDMKERSPSMGGQGAQNDRYGAGWPGRWARSWHAWCTGTPARLAAARM